jgi:hypothetical protein
MAKDWRCLIGRHEWRVVETATRTPGLDHPHRDRDKYAECLRCRKRDWTRALDPKMGPGWRGDRRKDPPWSGSA